MNILQLEYQFHYLKKIGKSNIISVTDHYGTIEYANYNFFKFSKFRSEDIIGFPFNIVRHPDMPKSIFSNLWYTIKQEQHPWIGFFKNKNKDKTSNYFFSVILPIENELGKIIKYLSIMHPIDSFVSFVHKNSLDSILLKLSQVDFYNSSLKQILFEIINDIFDYLLPEIDKKYGVFLWKEEKELLELELAINLPDIIKKECKEITLGECLCGQSAFLNKILWDNGDEVKCLYIDEFKKNYKIVNIPLIYGKQKEGVLFVYLPKNLDVSKEVLVDFFCYMGYLLGVIIYKYNLQHKVKKLFENKNRDVKLIRINSEIINRLYEASGFIV